MAIFVRTESLFRKVHWQQRGHMKDHIRKIIDDFGVEDLTAKSVRVKLEEVMGLSAGELKPKKEEISALIDAILSENAKVQTPVCEVPGTCQQSSTPDNSQDTEEPGTLFDRSLI